MADERPKDSAELLALIEGEWQALLQVAEGLTPEQMMRPDAGGWSPKDNLAHLAEWMRYLDVSYLHKKPASEGMGIDAERLKQLDEDGINAVLFERNRQLPASEVLTRLDVAFAAVLKSIKSMSFADLMKPLRESGPDKRLVIDTVLGNTSDHFREHRQTIERSLR